MIGLVKLWVFVAVFVPALIAWHASVLFVKMFLLAVKEL